MRERLRFESKGVHRKVKKYCISNANVFATFLEKTINQKIYSEAVNKWQ